MRPAAVLTRLGVGALLVAGGVGGWALSGQPLAARVERPVAAPDPRASARQFRTVDSLTVDASQIILQSRGTLVLVHGAGDHHPWMTMALGALADSLGFHVIGLSLRGQGATLATARAPYAYDRDVQAVIDELKRREPSGPVIVAGQRSGAAVALQALLDAKRAGRANPDGLILLNPVFDWCAAGALATWPRPLWQFPRRVRLARALRWLPDALGDRLMVAEEPAIAPERGVNRYPAPAWLGFCHPPSEEQWRGIRMPVRYLSPTPPAASTYPPDPSRDWRMAASNADFDVQLLAAIRDFMDQFSADAVYRTPIRAGTVVPVLPR